MVADGECCLSWNVISFLHLWPSQFLLQCVDQVSARNVFIGDLFVEDPGIDINQIQCVLETMYWPRSCASSASVFLSHLIKYIDSVFGFIV